MFEKENKFIEEIFLKIEMVLSRIKTMENRFCMRISTETFMLKFQMISEGNILEMKF